MRAFVRLLKDIFDDRLTRSALIIFLLIVALVTFNATFDIANAHPLLGVLAYAFVPILFIAGGIIFVMAILRS